MGQGRTPCYLLLSGHFKKGSQVKLNQVIAVEKTTKAQVQSDIDVIYKAAQKPALYEGTSKTYLKRREEDEDVPAQRVLVQRRAGDDLATMAHRWTRLFDVTAQKDYANCVAKADVVVDGQTLLAQAPVTYLLFVEKQLTDLRTIIGKFPVLDPSEQWSKDAGKGLFVTQPTQTTRTKKVQKPIVLYPATPEHPAQTQLIVEDEAVGTWNLVRESGALPETERAKMLSKIEVLLAAIKVAREEANATAAPEQNVGAAIFQFVLA